MGMNFCLLSENIHYIKAVEAYYMKHYSQKVLISFNESIQEDSIIIANDSLLELHPQHPKILLGCKNDVKFSEINQFQNYDVFFSYLLAYRPDSNITSNEFEIVKLFGSAGGLGCTTLSLNIATVFSQSHRTFWLSFDAGQKNRYYLPQTAKYSMSDIIFYLKQSNDHMEKDFKTETDFDYFNCHEYIEDVYLMDGRMIHQLCDLLKMKGYKRIVMDFGQRFDLGKKIQSTHVYFTIGQDLKHYQLTDDMVKYLGDNIHILINKRRLDQFVNDHSLNHVKRFDYIDYDHNLGDEKTRWTSITIQHQLNEILNQ